MPPVHSTLLHPTAVIHPSAKIGQRVEVGPFAVIGEDVVLGDGVRVGPHAVIEFSRIGSECEIHASAFVGTAPQDLKFKGERSHLEMGPRCKVRECVTLNRGTAAAGVTRIGSQCLFMAYSHVAHDCVIGNGVILANSVALAGHVEVGDFAVIGGLAAVHQFVRIGRLAMIGGGAMVPLDIPPFTMAWGDRARLNGLNAVGLRRAKVPAEAVSELKRLYRELFYADQPIREQIARLKQTNLSPTGTELLQFIETSPRGICRPSQEPLDDSSE